MNELMSWTTLGTLAGATAAVLLIVQYLKPLLPKLDTRLLALIVAVVIHEGAPALAGGAAQDYVDGVLNAVLVASTAMGAYGAYQVTFAASDAASKANSDDGGAEAGG